MNHSRRFASGIAILFLMGACAFGQSSVNKDSEFVIRNARIFDGSRVISKGDVWILNGKIKAIARQIKTPSRVHVIDATGETLLPGLIDAHVHTWGTALKEGLVFGVTTYLDMFADIKYAKRIKKAQADGQDLDQADLLSAGTLITAPKGHGTEYGLPIPTIDSPEGAQAFVDARIAEGSDYIKIVYDDGKTYNLNMPTLSKETMTAVIAAAHGRGKLAVVHIGSLLGARDAIESGADGLMHLFVDTHPDAEFASFVAQHHTFVVPTLSVLASIAGVPAGNSLASDARLRPYLSTDAVSNLGRMFPRKSGDFVFAQETVRQLKAHGVPVLAGTDAPNRGTAHGASMHGELELLVDSGMTPIEALVAATSASATAFRLVDRGQLAPGKRADLLLVKGNPTTDIKATRDIVSVWKRGVPVDRAAYRAALEKEKRPQSPGGT